MSAPPTAASNNENISKCPVDHSQFAGLQGNEKVWEAWTRQQAQQGQHPHAQFSIEDKGVQHQIMHELGHKHPENATHTSLPLQLRDEHKGYVHLHPPILSETDEAQLQRHIALPSMVQPLADAFQQAKQHSQAPTHPSRQQPAPHSSEEYSISVNDAFPDATPLPHQRIPLSAKKQHSTIPRAGIDEKTGKPFDTWIYPSPQRFFNAMTKKGFSPDERGMDVVVAIHNVVNEDCWLKIKAYEDEHKDTCPNPKLARMVGRPGEPSPKSFFKSLYSAEPFDRHDWYVDRCGKQVRYILEFYDSPPKMNETRDGLLGADVTKDVRPEMSFDRVKYFFKHLFS